MSGACEARPLLVAEPSRSDRLDARTKALLAEPVLPALLRLAWPNILVMVAQSGTGLIEMWFIARLGSDALLVPGIAICGGALPLIPLSPALIFGWGPFPPLGIAGGGFALLTTPSGRSFSVRDKRPESRLVPDDPHSLGAREGDPFGGRGSRRQYGSNQLRHRSHDGVHGGLRGTGRCCRIRYRLEYLMPPISFGLGAPLVALVGTNIGANQNTRALKIALIGGAVGFAVAEAIGATAAIWPHAWLTLFTHDPHIVAIGTAYLRTVGPIYGFFGLGISMYFASQGAGRLSWPLIGGLLRVIVAVGGGWIVLRVTGSTSLLLVVYASGMLLYGTVIAWSVAAGSWFNLYLTPVRIANGGQPCRSRARIPPAEIALARTYIIGDGLAPRTADAHGIVRRPSSFAKRFLVASVCPDKMHSKELLENTLWSMLR
ncbi:hypothetical protein ACVW1C_007448 [Bradyrhizobium sp. USDA 4011]